MAMEKFFEIFYPCTKLFSATPTAYVLGSENLPSEPWQLNSGYRELYRQLCAGWTSIVYQAFGRSGHSSDLKIRGRKQRAQEVAR